MTVAEAATLLGSCIDTVRRMVRKGELAIAKRGPHGRILVDAFEVRLLRRRSRGRPSTLDEEDAWVQLFARHGLMERVGDDEEDELDDEPDGSEELDYSEPEYEGDEVEGYYG